MPVWIGRCFWAWPNTIACLFIKKKNELDILLIPNRTYTIKERPHLRPKASTYLAKTPKKQRLQGQQRKPNSRLKTE